MKATIVGLRYKMKEILQALQRREKVEVFYRGKIKAILSPVNEQSELAVKDHPFFGMFSQDKSVDELMQDLRGGRHVV